MPTIQHSVTVPYTIEQMYQLVNDVGYYSEFLPWCTHSEILTQDAREVIARLTLSGAGFSKSFTTRNVLYPNYRIEINLLEGPFHHLEGDWTFESLDHQTIVRLNLEFELLHRWVDIALNPIFHQIASSLIDAFTQRAHKLYG
jgi:ribosome-associated toxin RatA of RatAB toxin-antitoxin module